MTFVLILIVLSAIGGVAYLVLRNRSEGIESGIVSFRREMRALAPPERRGGRRRAAASPDPEGDDPSGESG